MSEHSRRALLTCSGLLRYPDRDVIESAARLGGAIEELPAPYRGAIKRFLEFVASTDSITLQETYVSTFDMDEENSLYLTYNALKDDPSRGPELQRLKSAYMSAGFLPATDELPDYLPMFLEYAGMCDSGDAKHVLGRYAPLLADLATRLERKGSPYAPLVRACSAALRDLL